MTPAALAGIPTDRLTAWLDVFDACLTPMPTYRRRLADVVDDVLYDRAQQQAAAHRALTVPPVVNANARAGVPSNRRDGLDLTRGFAGMRRRAS